MSRRKLKLLAKSQISGNVIILFIMGIIANIDMWFYNIAQNAAIRRSGIIATLATLALTTGATSSSKSTAIANASIGKIMAQMSSLTTTIGICSIIFLILYYVVGAPLRISLAHTYIELGHEEKPKFEKLGYGFKKCWEQAALLCFFHGLFIFLWSLLLIIPGIIKSYSYAMSNYIMADNPEVGALEAITKSRKMMKGHKFRLFVLDLSFIFWYLLVAITFGIAGIYVDPYVQATKANFYLKLKETQVEEA